MKVLVSGSTGFIGSALVRRLAADGHEAVRLVRSASGRPGPETVWDPAAEVLDPAVLEGVDAVVHLAGESIASRWNEAKKRRIRESRIRGTRLLVRGALEAAVPPKVLAVASAIGYYGDRGDAWLDEDSAPGDTFLADVCQAWEDETRPAANQGIRVVNLRFGAVLGAQGGALATMLCPFKAGIGGIIGSGEQYMSWIALDDAVRAVAFALTHDVVHGPVNVVAPNPVTNRTFTKTLGRALGRPTVLPLPTFAARAVFGEMADNLLLASARVRPARLEGAGFVFEYPTLEGAIGHALGT